MKFNPAIIDFIKQQQLESLNLNIYNNNKDFEYYSDKLKLSGLFENYRLNLINEEINEGYCEGANRVPVCLR